MTAMTVTQSPASGVLSFGCVARLPYFAAAAWIATRGHVKSSAVPYARGPFAHQGKSLARVTEPVQFRPAALFDSRSTGCRMRPETYRCARQDAGHGVFER